MNLSPKALPRTWPQFVLGLTLPLSLLVAGLILDALPLITGSGRFFVPLFGLPALFFWSVRQPNSLPLILVFILGLCVDVLHSEPFGLNALGYLVVALIAQSQRLQLLALNLGFYWVFFTMALAAYAALRLIISHLVFIGLGQGEFFPGFLGMLQNILATVALYPFLHMMFSFLDRTLLYRTKAPF